MILESYVQALLRLIENEKVAVDDIKNAEYKAEVQARLGL